MLSPSFSAVLRTDGRTGRGPNDGCPSLWPQLRCRYATSPVDSREPPEPPVERTVAPMTGDTLRFETRRGTWFRYGWPAGVLTYTLAVAVLAILDHPWWMLIPAAGVSLSAGATELDVRTRTVITREKVTVQRGWRAREIPRAQIEAVTRHTAWEPVVLRLVSGQTVVLPRVRVSDLESIRHLIGQAG